MKKISFILGLVLSISLMQASVFADTAPRIAVWQGKVNQHIDTSTGQWASDPDGSSGAELDKLTYCKKWYPNTTSVSSGQTETITTWKRASYYEQSDYTNTVPTYNCVQGTVSLQPTITVLSPNGGETFTTGQQITVRWSTVNMPSDAVVVAQLFNTQTGYELGLDPVTTSSLQNGTSNDGVEMFTLPPNTPSAGATYDTFGNVFKMRLIVSSATVGNGIGQAIGDYSNNTFTIQSTGANTACSINSFTANPMTVSAGGIVDFAWNTNCANTGIKELDGFPNKNFGTTGTTNAVVDYTTTFTLNASNDSGCSGTVYSTTTGARCTYTTASATVTVQPTTSGDTTPRIMLWPGKVNQHTDTNGTWQTDPDGRSGGNNYLSYPNDYGGRELAYCKKWYPNTTSAAPYKSETISTWRATSNTGGYTGTFMSYKCVQGAVITTPSITVLSPNGGETYTFGQEVRVTWTSANYPTSSPIYVLIAYSDPTIGFGGTFTEVLAATTNTGNKVVTLPTNRDPFGPGTHYKIILSNVPISPQATLIDSSDSLFTIQAPTVNTSCTANASPSVTILSPNQGEVYQPGQQFEVTWNSCNIPRQHSLGIQLVDTTTNNKFVLGGGMYRTTPDTADNNGLHTAKFLRIPTVAALTANHATLGSTFKVQLKSDSGQVDGVSVADTSDGVFSISDANLPSGCASTAGYSTTTGQPCSLPEGCSANSGFSTITGQPCVPTGGRSVQSATTTTSTTGATTPSFTRELKVGVSGTDVSALQTRLKTEGVYTGKISGYFGTVTQAAVKKFQTKYGIPAVGTVGPRTLQVLNK